MLKLFNKIKEQPLCINFSILCISFFIIWLILLFIPSYISSSQLPLFFDLYYPFKDTFNDFFNPVKYIQDNLLFEELDYESRMWRCYSPAAFFIYKMSVQIINASGNDNISNMQHLLNSIYLTAGALLAALLITSNLKTERAGRILFTIAFLTSSIFLFTYERANIIILSMLLSAFFIFYHDSKNKIVKELSLIALACAFCLKLSPAVLGLLLIYKKDYKSAFRTFFYGAVLFILPSLTFPRGIETIETFKENLMIFSSVMVHYNANPQSFSSGKGLLYLIFNNHTQAVNIVIYIMTAFLILCSFFYKQYWRKVFVLVLAMIYVPAVTSLYGLVYLLPVIILYFNECSEKFKNKTDCLYLIYFAVLFLQIQFYISNININILLKHVVVLVILVHETIFGIIYFYKNNCCGILKTAVKRRINVLKYKLKNKKQYAVLKTAAARNTALILLSLSVIYAGRHLYKNNYEYIEYNLKNITAPEIISDKPIILKNDFVIKINMTYTPDKTKGGDIIFKTSDDNQGIFTAYYPDKNIIKTHLDLSNGDNMDVNVPVKIKADSYEAEIRLTPETISAIYYMESKDSFASEKICEKRQIDRRLIQKIITPAANGKIDNLQFYIKNGNNSSLIIIAALFAAFLPLFMIFYYKKLRKY